MFTEKLKKYQKWKLIIKHQIQAFGYSVYYSTVSFIRWIGTNCWFDEYESVEWYWSRCQIPNMNWAFQWPHCMAKFKISTKYSSHLCDFYAHVGNWRWLEVLAHLTSASGTATTVNVQLIATQVRMITTVNFWLIAT